METDAKVFVTKFQPDWDFSPAVAYGEVIFLTESEHRPEPSSPQYNDRVTAEIKSRMQDYIPGRDFIVVTAAAVGNIVVSMILAKTAGPHNVLRWNNRRNKYDLHKIRSI